MSIIPSAEWPEQKVDYEEDCSRYLEKAWDREAMEKKDEDLVPTDKTGGFPKHYKVFVHEHFGPMDVYMTKVDLKNGIYGDYLFYKIQLLHDSNKDLYIVFTRYGWIGEEGMNQRTPFAKLDEAIKEYSTIYKQKSGNMLGDAFEKKDKKYVLVKMNYRNVNFKDYIIPFSDLPESAVAKSTLNPKLWELMSAITDSTSISKAMNYW